MRLIPETEMVPKPRENESEEPLAMETAASETVPPSSPEPTEEAAGYNSMNESSSLHDLLNIPIEERKKQLDFWEYTHSSTEDEFSIIDESSSIFSENESDFERASNMSTSSVLSLVPDNASDGPPVTCNFPSPVPSPVPVRPTTSKPKKKTKPAPKKPKVENGGSQQLVDGIKSLSVTNKLSGSQSSLASYSPRQQLYPTLPVSSPTQSISSRSGKKKKPATVKIGSHLTDEDMKSISGASSSSSTGSKKKNKKAKEEEQPKEPKKANLDNRNFFGAKGEYVEGVWEEGKLKEVSALQFLHPVTGKVVYIRKQATGYLFTYDADDFVARVSLGFFDDLVLTKPANEIKQLVLGRARIIKVLEDKTLEKRNEAYESLKRVFKRRLTQSLDDLDCAEDLYQLSTIVPRTADSQFDWLLREILRNNYISAQLKGAIEKYCESEKIVKETIRDFSHHGQYSNVQFRDELHEIYRESIEVHKKTLHDKFLNNICGLFAQEMHDPFESLNEKGTLLVGRKDLALFQDLVVLLQEHFWPGLVVNSWESLFKSKIKTLCRSPSLKSVAPITHPIYFHLCKSFQELAQEISQKTDTPIADLYLVRNANDWDVVENIHWPNDSLLSRCLEQQYRFIIKLIKHYEPGKYSSKNKFTRLYKLQKSLHNFGNLADALSEATDDLSFISSLQKMILGDTSVPEENIVWTYIFDEAITGIQDEHGVELFEPLINGFKEFIQKAPEGRYELFRVATHNTVRFIANTLPYLSDGVSNSDQTVLTAQIGLINFTIQNSLLDEFRDLIDVFNEYWNRRENIIEKIHLKFPHEHFKSKMTTMSQSLQNLVLKAFADIEHLNLKGFVTFFRSFNEFVEDLNGLEFVWYVKSDRALSAGAVVANENKQSYRVTNPSTYISELQKITPLVPPHYIIETILALLNCVRILLEKEGWTKRKILLGAGELLSAIRKSFLYFKEQPDYESFEIFQKENVDPFLSAVTNSSNYEDFKRRVEIVGDSFWYLRKQDEIDVTKALQLFQEINDGSIDQAVLKNAYDNYLTNFNSYIEKTLEMDDSTKINFVVKDVKKILKNLKKTDTISLSRALQTIGVSEGMKISDWGINFKRKDIPKLLSGLAVVWSILASKDISSTGKNLKPHCIQILCILRLLSIDKPSKGVEKHLTQVLTGQGKSLVLGLLSTLLALLGYEVRTVCYSDYLASRDGDDFYTLFNKFDVRDKITYGTFEDMANAILRPTVNDRELSLRDMVDDRILKHKIKVSGRIRRENLNNTILLIDEVDVFFTEQFYGNLYGACTTFGLPALPEIQKMIWKLVKGQNYDSADITLKIKSFILSEQSDEFNSFREFLSSPVRYGILNNKAGKKLTEVFYTNQSLFDEHLAEMIKCAIAIAQGRSNDWFIQRFRLNTNGVVAYRRDNGRYETTCYPSYYNAFNYFRLKKIDFDHKYYKNFGYFNIHCGSISYAKLPEKYPLILGVSGTLKGLDVNEKRAISETYNIKQISSMPSFFGRANLKFDPWNDFCCETGEPDWMCRIFKSANGAVLACRSVMIFFQNDVMLNKFKEKYLGKFDRFHTLTNNSTDHEKKKHIEEAGIAKTVTLATREMGRGLDFKSSVAVEKTGGVHVIQTFFSLDIKEETQIKGRTARKDNKGSYELIVCNGHLEKDGFISGGEDSITYASLHQKRLQLLTNLRENDNKRVQDSEEDHNVSLKYYETFFY